MKLLLKIDIYVFYLIIQRFIDNYLKLIKYLRFSGRAHSRTCEIAYIHAPTCVPCAAFDLFCLYEIHSMGADILDWPRNIDFGQFFVAIVTNLHWPSYQGRPLRVYFLQLLSDYWMKSLDILTVSRQYYGPFICKISKDFIEELLSNLPKTKWAHVLYRIFEPIKTCANWNL